MTAPNGCAECGVVERDHPWLWSPNVGWHRYLAPTNAHRLARMRRNRATRPFA